MKETAVPGTAHAYPGESSFFSLLSGWVQQGVENFFATQRILVDLAMRKNASLVDVVRGRFAESEFCPMAIAKEVAGDGLANIIEGHKLLLDLVQRESEIITSGVKERSGDAVPINAAVDAVRRSIEMFVEMQHDYLDRASEQVHGRMAAAKAGAEYKGDSLVDLAREGLENFVSAQKKFLDVISDEMTKAIATKPTSVKGKKTELSVLAQQAADALIDSQKKMMDVARKQVHASLKTAARAAETVPSIPYMAIPDLTREGVRSFVDAEKAVIDSMTRRPAEPQKKATKAVRRIQRPHRTRKPAPAPVTA